MDLATLLRRQHGVLTTTRRVGAPRRRAYRACDRPATSEGRVWAAMLRGRRGSAAMGDLLVRAADGAVSELEHRAHAMLRAGGVEGWRARENARQPAGWMVLQFMWWDVVLRPERCLARLREARARATAWAA